MEEITTTRVRVLLLSIAPPENHCGVRVVLHRHLVERNPFDVLVATNADYVVSPQPHVQLRLPYLLQRVRKSRFGPSLRRWLADFENLVWPALPNRALDDAVRNFRPDVILALADNHLGELALQAARRHRLPLAGLFLDWVPVMESHYGHYWTCGRLSRRFRRFYGRCDLAFCTSDGMQEMLGPHTNSHTLYPMPGRYLEPSHVSPPSRGKLRLVYVGSVRSFYGRMLCDLLDHLEPLPDWELIVVGPDADWPPEMLDRASARGVYLGFKPPREAAEVLAGADALLVVMSFEKEHELFMRTSFTTKFLDYVAFGKPVILWGPEYCTPFRVAQKHGGALIVDRPDAAEVVAACRGLAASVSLRDELSRGARRLHEAVFNPDRLQEVFVTEIEAVARRGHSGSVRALRA